MNNQRMRIRRRAAGGTVPAASGASGRGTGDVSVIGWAMVRTPVWAGWGDGARWSGCSGWGGGAGRSRGSAAGVSHGGEEVLRGLGDAREVALEAAGLGDEAADADRGHAGVEPLLDVVRVRAARGGERDAGQRRQDGADVVRAEELGREELHHVGTGRDGVDDLGGGERAADRDRLVAVRDGDHVGVELRADQHPGAGRDGGVGGVPVQDRAGTDDDVVVPVLVGQPPDDLQRRRHGQGDLQGLDPAGDGRLRDVVGQFGVVEPDDEHRAGLGDQLEGGKLREGGGRRHSGVHYITNLHMQEQSRTSLGSTAIEEAPVAESVPLIPEQRQQRLLQLLRAQGVVSIRTLTEELGVSHMTVRRDIAALEADGQVVSVQGGVRLAGSSGIRPPSSRDARQVLELPRKQAIAEQAAGLVDDGMTVFLDAGTTCQADVPFLVGRRELTVVTNDFHVVTALFQQPEIETIHTGGLVDVESGSSTGRLAAATLSGIALDLALLSTGAWSVARGVTAAAQDQVTLKLAAIAAAPTCAVVADSTKFGASSRYRVAELERFDVVVTDEDLPEDGRRAVAELGVDVRLAAVPAS